MGVSIFDITGTVALADLTDVSLSSLLDGQYLRYNSSTAKWNNASISEDIYNSLTTSLLSTNGITLSYNTGLNTITFGLGNITPQSVTASGIISSSNINGSVTGTNTGDQTIVLTGDVTGTGTGTFVTTLANVNLATGTYGSSSTIPVITVNAKGLVTNVTTVPVTGGGGGTSGTATTVAGGTAGSLLFQAATDSTAFLPPASTNHVLIGGPSAPSWSTAPAISGANITSIPVSALNSSSLTIGSTSVSLGGTTSTLSGLTSVTSTTFNGTLAGNASTASKLITPRTISAGGDATWSVNFDGSTNITSGLILSTVNATPGTFGSATQIPVLTVNAKGLVTNVSTINATAPTITLTGDITGTGTSTINASLPNVNLTTGTFGNASQIPIVTVNSKGLVTNVTTVAAAGGGGGGSTQFVSVLDYGADSSGVSASDAAFNAAAGVNGFVYVPPGTYLIGAPISTSATWWIAPGATITGLSSSTYGVMDLSRLTGRIVQWENGQYRTARFGSNSLWLEKDRWRYSQAIAEVSAVSRYSEIGILGASRTSDNPAQTLGSIGVAAYSVNDSTSPKEPAWGMYVNHQKVNGSGPSYGIEIDNVNKSSTFNATPYNMGDGLTSDRSFNLWLTCGAGDGILGAGNAVSAAIGIAANPTPFNRGIIFPAGSVNSSLNEIVTSFNGGRIAWYDFQGGTERVSGHISSAGPVAGLDFTIRNQNTNTVDQGMRLDGSQNSLRPFGDNNLKLGTNTNRWQEVWAVNTTVGAVGYVELPSSIGTGSNSGIPNRGPTTLAAQYGTMASPATGSNERALSSQAVVNAPYPWSSPSHWSPNEVSVINVGVGRVNALNAVLVTSTDLQMDNTAMYNYAKASYSGAVSGAGGVVGYWSIVDTRGSRKRGVGAEFVLLHDAVNRYDPVPKSGLSENAEDPNGAFHVGVRISTLLSSKIITRGLDLISGSTNAGFDTGINIQAFRSRGLFIHNNLDAAVGGARAGIEFADTVDNTLVWNTKDGTPYIFQQNFSASKGYYYNFRKDSNNNWLAMYADGTVTVSGNVSTGAKLLVNPDGAIFAGHTTATAAGFHVPNTGKFWLSSDKNTYFTFNGSSVILVKNGTTVASW